MIYVLFRFAVLEASLHFPNLPIARFFDVKIRLCMTSMNFMSSRLIVSTSIFVDPSFSLLKDRLKELFTGYLSEHFTSLDRFLKKAEKNINPSQDILKATTTQLTVEATEVSFSLDRSSSRLKGMSILKCPGAPTIPSDDTKLAEKNSKSRIIIYLVLLVSLLILFVPFMFQKRNSPTSLSFSGLSSSHLDFLKNGLPPLSNLPENVQIYRRKVNEKIVHNFERLHRDVFVLHNDMTFLIRELTRLRPDLPQM